MNRTTAVFILLLTASSCSLISLGKKVSTGTYSRTLNDSIATMTETIVVAADPHADNRYRIYQKSITRYKAKDAPRKLIMDSTMLNARFEPDDATLHTDDPGIVISFDNRTQTININNISYKKVE